MKTLRNLITENVQYLVNFQEQVSFGGHNFFFMLWLNEILESYFKEGKDKEGKSKKDACESYLRYDLRVLEGY